MPLRAVVGMYHSTVVLLRPLLPFSQWNLQPGESTSWQTPNHCALRHSSTHLVSHDASVWTTSQVSVRLSCISTVTNVFSLCKKTNTWTFIEGILTRSSKTASEQRKSPCLQSVLGSPPQTWHWPRRPAGSSGSVRIFLLRCSLSASELRWDDAAALFFL